MVTQSLPAPASPTVAPHDELRIRAPAPRGGPGCPLALLGVRRRPLVSHTGPVALPGFRCTSSALQGSGGGQVTLSGGKGLSRVRGSSQGSGESCGLSQGPEGTRWLPRSLPRGQRVPFDYFRGPAAVPGPGGAPGSAKDQGVTLRASQESVDAPPLVLGSVEAQLVQGSVEAPPVLQGSVEAPPLLQGLVSSGDPGVSRGSSVPPRVSLLRSSRSQSRLLRSWEGG